MFFKSDYHDLLGPGSDKVPLGKDGLPRFRDVMASQYAALLRVNLLFVLGCLPVVTIPLSLYTMNSLVYQMVLDRPLKGWWETFWQSWKRGWLAFLLTALPLVCAGYGMWFYLSLAKANLLFLLPFVVCSTIFLVTLLSSGCLYGLLDSGRDWREALRLALILGVAKPRWTVPAALCGYGLPILAVLLFPLSGLYLVLIGFSIPCLFAYFFLRTALKPCMDGADGGAPAESE